MNKSLFRRPGTKTFQLVHRSQRDPLINDPDSSDRVLKEIDATQGKSKGSSSKIDEFELDETVIGDASSYGIYFDDEQYNYMQHLRPVGQMDSFLVEAPLSKKEKGKGKAPQSETNGGFLMRDLPESALPSHPLDEISYNDLTEKIGTQFGLQPDLNQNLRQVLEALDDDAFAVDDGLGTDGEDEFWSEVVKGGEKEEWELEEEEGEEDYEEEGEDVVAEPEGWEARVARFKRESKGKNNGNSDDEEEMTEGGDTIADLRASNARRPPRKANSQAGSQFSMTSSAMFRNAGLQTLDEQFDQIEKMYAEDSDSSWQGSLSGSDEESDDDELPPMLQPQRQDLDEIMDDFLSRYEVLGGKIRHVLEPSEGVEGGAGKLDRIRRELASLDIGDEIEEGEDPVKTARRREKEKILEAVDRQELEASTKKDKIRLDWEKPKERWDCETVLSTYSNVSNHPRLLRMRDLGPKIVKIKLDPKTGFPIVEEEINKEIIIEELGEDDIDDEDDMVPDTIKRPRNESSSDRKARKDLIKVERLARRNQKSSTKEAFSNETKKQNKAAAKAVAGGKSADIKVGNGVRRLA